MVTPALRFAPPAVAAVMLVLIVTGGPLPSAARAIAIACIVVSAVAAVVVRRPDVRTHATVALAVAAFAAAGQTRGGGRYALGSTIFIAVAVAALRVPRTSGARTQGRGRALGVLAAVSCLTAGLLIWQLPHLGGIVERRIARWLGAIEADEISGFSSTMRLGSTHGMLLSDKIVLRASGEDVDYLRGAVYDRYDFGEWSSSTDLETRRVEASASPQSGATTQLVFARGARVARGSEARWFIPRGACDLGTPSGRIEIDGNAVAHPVPANDAAAIWFRTGSCAMPPAEVSAPSAIDRSVDSRINVQVARVAAAWTADAPGDRAKIAAILGRLRTFGYSLDVHRDPHFDPIVDFLTIHNEGHCELFASAMVLLARSEGIPARVVTGYRGGERNAIAGYTIVRERNAHAWVEAFVDGAWRTYDPTPIVETGMRSERTRLDDVADGVWFAVERAITAVTRVTLVEWGIGLAGVAVVLYAVREIGLRLGSRRKRRATAFARHDPALPAFDALDRALASAGHARAASEPIEAFARRIVGLDAPWAQAAGDALVRYAALRYGDRGDEGAIVSAMERAARAVVT